MTEGTSSPPLTEQPRRNWWQTVPGVLTAIAAVLSATTGLVVAISQIRGSQRSHDAAPQTQVGTSPTGRAEPSVRPQPVPSGVEGPQTATAALTRLPAGSEMRLAGGKLVLRIVSATVEPFNQTMRTLRLNIRFTNNGETFDRNYYWTFRLLVDGVPRAPEDGGRYEQIEAHSAKELEYAFIVPSSPGRVVLKVSNAAGQEAEVPFDLP